MAKPWIHAESSARKFGGKPADYIAIHDLLDSSKSTVADSRHRALTHNAWFIATIVEKLFGHNIINSDNVMVSTRTIAEEHVLEDYRMRFIPAASDFLQEMEIHQWMVDGRGRPPSAARLFNRKTIRKVVD